MPAIETGIFDRKEHNAGQADTSKDEELFGQRPILLSHEKDVSQNEELTGRRIVLATCVEGPLWIAYQWVSWAFTQLRNED